VSAFVWILIVALIIGVIWLVRNRWKEERRASYWSQLKKDIVRAADQMKVIRLHWERTVFDSGDGEYVLRGPVKRRSEDDPPPEQVFVALALLLEMKSRAKHLKPEPPDEGVHATYLNALEALIAQAQDWSKAGMERADAAWERLYDDLTDARNRR
jgi:hypothetical protein